MAPARRSPVDDIEAFATTVGRYVLGEISLGKAAERVGLTRWELEDLLEEAGVELRLGPQSREALDDDINTALTID
jgi:predicted HTH domain antitoxin